MVSDEPLIANNVTIDNNNNKKIWIWPMQTVRYASPAKSDRCICICCTGLDPALTYNTDLHTESSNFCSEHWWKILQLNMLKPRENTVKLPKQ